MACCASSCDRSAVATISAQGMSCNNLQNCFSCPTDAGSWVSDAIDVVIVVASFTLSDTPGQGEGGDDDDYIDRVRNPTPSVCRTGEAVLQIIARHSLGADRSNG